MMRELSLIAIAGCVGCVSTADPPGGPRGLRVDEHLEVAHNNDVIAADHRTWPAPTVMTPGELDAMPKVIPFPIYPSIVHEEVAGLHRSEAAVLMADYQTACGQRSIAEVTVSPLDRFQIGGYETDRGVVVLLDAAAGKSDEVVQLMECHRAWLMLDARSTDDNDDPLDVPDLFIEARADREAIAVSLTPSDPEWIPELQRRVAARHEARGRTAQTRRSGPEASDIP
jgi:hypothetical protein